MPGKHLGLQALANMWGKSGNSKEVGEPAPEPTGSPAGAGDLPDDVARKILLENPDISAATFYNTLKTRGITLSKGKEADDTTSHSPSLRARGGKKGVKAVKKEASKIVIHSLRLIEAKAQDNGIGPTRFRAVLIQEGLGNFRDGFYYTKEALNSAITVFEGKKIYADHPSSQDEETRPERSVRDVLGHFEGVRIEEGEDGQSMLTADVHIMEDQHYAWARGLMRHAVTYSKKFTDKDFVGLSINASGDAEEVELDKFIEQNEVPEAAALKLIKAKEEGLARIKVVSAINEAVSCDLVTEAGAGGRVTAMIEQEKELMAKKIKKVVAKEAAEAVEAVETVEQPAGDATAAGHDDAAADTELFKKLLAKHLGTEADGLDEAAQGLHKEAYEAAKELGMDEAEAMKCAAGYAKIAKHMSGKKGEEAPVEEKPEEALEAVEAVEAVEPVEAVEAAETKESAETLKLRGENAKLKESIRARDLVDFMDKKLAESGLSRENTKKIRESIGTPKSEKDIERAIDGFMSGYNARGESGPVDFVLNVEKVGERSEGFSLADCKH